MDSIYINEVINRQQCLILFQVQREHRFVNGYESILGCPALCDTNSIIYAFTCPCSHYDYIGDTSRNLVRCLLSHRSFTYRFIIGTLI
jgi:hypothetical protein